MLSKLANLIKPSKPDGHSMKTVKPQSALSGKTSNLVILSKTSKPNLSNCHISNLLFLAKLSNLKSTHSVKLANPTVTLLKLSNLKSALSGKTANLKSSHPVKTSKP